MHRVGGRLLPLHARDLTASRVKWGETSTTAVLSLVKRGMAIDGRSLS